MVPFPDWWQSIQWIYHHADPHVLEFPDPALDIILKHKNKGLFLIFENRKQLLEESNQGIEIEFQNAAQKLYREFRCTVCFLEDEKCLKFLKETIHAVVQDSYPKIVLTIPIHDFRGEFLGVKYTQPEFSAQKIVHFAQNFYSSSGLALDVYSEPEEEGELARGKLVGLNIFKQVMKTQNKDQVILFYRSLLEEDQGLLEKFLELKKDFAQVSEEVEFYFYDVDKNAHFQDLVKKDKDLPALRVFQREFHNKSSKLFKNITSFLEVLMFLNDQLTEDYSSHLQAYVY